MRAISGSELAARHAQWVEALKKEDPRVSFLSVECIPAQCYAVQFNVGVVIDGQNWDARWTVDEFDYESLTTEAVVSKYKEVRDAK